jgi:hypothetical protein
MIVKPQSSLKNCIDPPFENVVRLPARIVSQFNFSCPVDAAATDFFRFETTAFEFYEPD